MIIPADVPEIAGTIHTSMSVNKSTNIVARVSLLTGGEETIMVVMTHYTFTYNSHFNWIRTKRSCHSWTSIAVTMNEFIVIGNLEIVPNTPCCWSDHHQSIPLPRLQRRCLQDSERGVSAHGKCGRLRDEKVIGHGSYSVDFESIGQISSCFGVKMVTLNIQGAKCLVKVKMKSWTGNISSN